MKGGILCSLAFHHQAVCPCHHNTQLGMSPPDGDPDANSSDAPPDCLNAPPCPPVPAKSTSGSSKPHRAHGDLGWRAIQAAGGGLTLARFRLLRRLGGGDIGSVYLCKLRGTEGGGALFAMKVMDKAVLGVRNKLGRVETERAILELLDHPFLPTLYAHLDTPQLSCMVMDFCAGGDLHVLRQLQPGRRFSEQATRFYAAEVLLAFEYLHMMGIIYRDLKPENVLVREDGHIMLSDFDLSLRCQVSPTLSLPRGGDDEEATASPTSAMSCHCYFCSRLSRDSFLTSSCITPCGVHPVASCLPIFPRHRRKPRGQHRHHPRPHNPAAHGLPELVAEPTSVRSMSFVGTHEYLAPEIVAGHGHGSAVDWWTFGVFLFEMLYGRTPFKGPNNHKTLTNIVTQALQFPPLPLEEDEDENDDEEEEGEEGEESDVNEKEEAADVDEGEEEALVEEPSEAAKQLMRGLLSKDPRRRLASVRGAAEIRQHRFFQGVNWALIRCSTPPWIPPPFTPPPPSPESASKNHPPHPFPGDDSDDDGDGDDNDEEERAPFMVIEGFPPGYTPNFEPF